MEEWNDKFGLHLRVNWLACWRCFVRINTVIFLLKLQHNMYYSTKSYFLWQAVTAVNDKSILLWSRQWMENRKIITYFLLNWNLCIHALQLVQNALLTGQPNQFNFMIYEKKTYNWPTRFMELWNAADISYQKMKKIETSDKKED